ncbi:extracellular solute-binding protein [Clostridium tagluense]|uniref:extracellular solute-binding protein n=1 Tax=Clostridium tagluense TaxID=360422 RepID=UPI001CF38CFB|nr:extracellular solute-binding protein [Clostridium tagluense]MCB2296282.1 extracellular solute-binding protein [Clostridium tagluense]
MKKASKIITISLVVCSLLFTLIGCSASGAQKVVIYTNADEEAVASMKKSLDSSGYQGKYVLQTQGTSELGGKLMAEGDEIEANLVTMSSYFIDSAQKKNNMFENLNFTTNSLEKYPSYYTPILANTGAIFVNTKVMSEKGLAMPKSIKDLTKDEYKGLVSIPNIMNSSTAWLLIQAIISEYGEKEGKVVLNKLIVNCGPHIETSGSGPIKKVRVGEAAVGFGLRHQAVADITSGKDIDYIDPIEGNYSLTESIAVVKKKDTATTKLAMEMAKVIVTKSRSELIKNYPVALYTGETIDKLNKPGNPKKFESPLTVELLAKHQEFFKASK